MHIQGKSLVVTIFASCATLALLSTATSVIAASTAEACDAVACGRVTQNSIVIDGVPRTVGEEGQPRRIPNRGSTAATPAAFEFRRWQVCGGPGYVPEGGTGCAGAGCVDPELRTW